MEEKGILYYLIMGILAALCILGIRTFLKNLRHNYWWRWVYVLGGGYLLFDLFAIAVGLEFWADIIRKMYDITSPYWTILWLTFILLGGASFILGISLFRKSRKIKR